MLIANFVKGREDAKTDDLKQWDYGRKLAIHGLDLPKAVEIHFAIEGSSDDAIRRIGNTADGVTIVSIPDSVVEQPRNIIAYVYISNTESGKTTNEIYIPMTTRQKPEAFDKPEDEEIFRETIETVNAAANRAEDSEKSAEAWVHGHEEYPDRAEDNAKYYSDQAHEGAVDAEKSKQESSNILESVSIISGEVRVNKEETASYKEQAAKSASDTLLSERNAKNSETASLEAQTNAEIAEGQAQIFAEHASESADRSEAAKGIVMGIGQDILENKNHVDEKVEAFDAFYKQSIRDVTDAKSESLKEIKSTKNQSVQAVTDEGSKQVQNVQEVVEGISQEETAQQILGKFDQTIPFLELIAENIGKAGSLNGFGLEKGTDDSVVITYTNPDTEVLEGAAMFPKDSTLQKIDTALDEMNASLKIIALQKGVSS